MNYLAAPYSHADQEVMEARYQFITKVTGHLMKKGEVIFSPVTHSHPVAMIGNVPNNWEFWRKQDFAILERCDRLLVLMLQGWDVSVGVSAEILFANSLGMSVRYINLDELPDEFHEGVKA